MTCIVGVSDGRRAIMGGDRGQGFLGGDGIPPESYPSLVPKIWRAGDVVLGGCGTLRFLQVLRRELPAFEGGDLDAWLCGSVTDFLHELVKREDILPAKSMLMVMHGAELRTISAFDCHFMAGSATSGGLIYSAIGAGRHWAYGSLWTSGGLGAGIEVAARVALEAAAYHSPCVEGPFDFLSSSEAAEAAFLVPEAPSVSLPARL